MNTSMLLGRIAGVPVRAHWSMALIAALFSVTLTPEYGAVTASFVVFALFASILAHEIGHAVVARRFGVNTESIDLWALGGVARLDRESPTPRADGLIAVAGPATSLAIGLIAGGVGIVLQVPVVFYIGFLNIALSVFNMLPGPRSTAAGSFGLGAGHGRATATGRRATQHRRDEYSVGCLASSVSLSCCTASRASSWDWSACSSL